MPERNMDPKEEAKANEFGDKLAREVLGLQVDRNASPDSQGRTRWKMPGGNKTGVGLLRTMERFFEEQLLVESVTGRKA
jgi:hypothetical protein